MKESADLVVWDIPLLFTVYKQFLHSDLWLHNECYKSSFDVCGSRAIDSDQGAQYTVAFNNFIMHAQIFLSCRYVKVLMMRYNLLAGLDPYPTPMDVISANLAQAT